VRSWMRQVKIEFIEDIDLSILDETHDVHLESIPSSKVFSPNESWCNPLLRPRSTATSGSLLSQIDDQITPDSLGVGRTRKVLSTPLTYGELSMHRSIRPEGARCPD
jgi:hypothetical protein